MGYRTCTMKQYEASRKRAINSINEIDDCENYQNEELQDAVAEDLNSRGLLLPEHIHWNNLEVCEW